MSFIVILQLTHFGFKLTVWEELYFMVNCKAYSRTLPFSNECVRVDDLNKRTDFVQSLVSSRVLSNLTLSEYMCFLFSASSCSMPATYSKKTRLSI